MEEHELKKKKFRSQAPPWAATTPPPPSPITKKKRKWRPGIVVLWEIKKYQKSIDPIILKAPFLQLVREIMEKYSSRVDPIQGAALEALQEAFEDICVSLFQGFVLCMAHAKRVTLRPVDMSLALQFYMFSSVMAH